MSETKGNKASKGTWKLMDRTSTIVGALIAQRAATLVWRITTGRKPPTQGRHPEVGTTEAIAWAIIGGALVELTKVSIRRLAAEYWVKSTGDLPPGMKPLAPAPNKTAGSTHSSTKPNTG